MLLRATTASGRRPSRLVSCHRAIDTISLALDGDRCVAPPRHRHHDACVGALRSPPIAGCENACDHVGPTLSRPRAHWRVSPTCQIRSGNVCTSRHPESATRDEGSQDAKTPAISRSFAVFAAQDDVNNDLLRGSLARAVCECEEHSFRAVAVHWQGALDIRGDFLTGLKAGSQSFDARRLEQQTHHERVVVQHE